MKSTANNAFPTSSGVNFFKIKAAMSVPPEDASLLKIIAEPMAVRSIAYTNSKSGWFVSGEESGINNSKRYVRAE